MMEKVGEHDQNILDEFTKNYKKKKKSAGLAQHHSEVLVVPLANMYPEASFQTALKT